MPVVPFPSYPSQPGRSSMLIRAKTKTGAVEFNVEPGESILYAGLRSGVPLPYECATGTCGTCKGRGGAGDVQVAWPQAPGASYIKAERGDFLMCQATASAACDIEIPAAVDPARSPVHRPVHGRGRIVRIERLTHDVMAIHVDIGRVISFQAGQFLVMRTAGIEGYRAYSMVNFAPATSTLEFVIKRKPGGKFCDWLFEGARAGAEFDWFGPLGKATFEPAEQRSILAIAGGSGIASIMSILALGHQSMHFDHFDATIFFGVRGNQDVFYAERLNDCAAAFNGRVRVVVALSHEAAGDELKRNHPAIEFASGFVHEVAGREMAGKMAGRVAYLAGPPPMVDAAIRMLILQGRLPAADVRYDKFG
jgi:toluene monooxygenase electron transfer component